MRLTLRILGIFLFVVLVSASGIGSLLSSRAGTGSQNAEVISAYAAPAQVSLDDTSKPSIRFAVLSDTHIPKDSAISANLKNYLLAVASDTQKLGLDFGVITGDAIDSPVGNFPEDMQSYQNNFGNHFTIPFIATYGDHGEEFGKHRAINRVASSIFGGTFTEGSYNTDGKGWYFEQNKPYFWSMTYNGVHFVFLASAFASDIMMDWLKKDLKENSKYVTILLNHHAAQPLIEGLNDHDRAKLFAIVDENPQVVGLIAGHTHRGLVPVLLTNNMYQFWPWKNAQVQSNYVLYQNYLVYMIRNDGLFIFERSISKNTTALIFSLPFQDISDLPTTVHYQENIKLSLPYLMRENQTISFPFVELNNAKIRLWGVETNQIINPTTAEFTLYNGITATPNAFINGTVTRMLGNEKISATQFVSSSPVTNLQQRWGYVDVLKNLDLSKPENADLQYELLASIKTKNNILQTTGLELIDNNKNEIIETFTVTHRSVDLFYNIRFQVVEGLARGYIGASTASFSNVDPSQLTDVTLRFWVGPGQTTSTTAKIDIGLFVQNRNFMLAPLEKNGLLHSQNVQVVAYGDKLLARADNLEEGKYVEKDLGSILSSAGDMNVRNVDGSRAVLVELSGDTLPVLNYVNPRKTIVDSDDGNDITTVRFEDRLYSSSNSLQDTIIFVFGGHKQSNVMHFSGGSGSLQINHDADQSAPQFESRSTISSGAGNFIFTRPSGTNQGDLLISFLGYEKGSDVTITPPFGWTLIRRIDSGTNNGAASYYKIAGASEPASYTFALTNSPKIAGGVARYSGVDPDNPINVSAASSGSPSTSQTAPSVTSTIDNTKILVFYSSKKAMTYAPAVGTGERWDAPNNSEGQPSNMMADFERVLAGATGTRTATTSEVEVWDSITVALSPSTTFTFLN